MNNIEEILNLRKGGLTYKEIANELNMPVGTVKSYLSRCKVKPKEHIEEPIIRLSNNIVVTNITRICLNCGKELTGNSNKKFCSNNCRLRHWRQMKYE